jgi:hypothetical protein
LFYSFSSSTTLDKIGVKFRFAIAKFFFLTSETLYFYPTIEGDIGKHPETAV